MKNAPDRVGWLAAGLCVLLAVTACDFTEFTGRKKNDGDNAERAQCVISRRAFDSTPPPAEPPRIDPSVCRPENLKCDYTIFCSRAECDGGVPQHATVAMSIFFSVKIPVMTMTISTREAVDNNPALFQDLNYVEARCFLGADAKGAPLVSGESNDLDLAARKAVENCLSRR